MEVDVFISYSHHDRDFAQKLKAHLESVILGSGPLQVWIDDDRINDGDVISNEVTKNLEAAALVLLLMSPDSMRSEYVTYEWGRAIFELQKEVLLVHLRECKNVGMWEHLYRVIKIPPLLFAPADDEKMTLIAAKVKSRLKSLPELRGFGRILLSTADPSSKIEAAEKLGNLGELNSIVRDYLRKAVDHQLSGSGYGPTQSAIARAFNKMGDRACIPSLARLLFKADTNVKNDALEAMISIRERELGT